MYSRVSGQSWIKQMVVGAFLFPGILSSITLFINTIAIYYHASRAIPFTSMVGCMFGVILFNHCFQLAIICICAFVILPLNFIGTLLGRNLKGQADIPASNLMQISSRAAHFRSASMWCHVRSPTKSGTSSLLPSR